MFVVVFLAVSLHDELKNTIKMFPKTRTQQKLKKNSKKGRCIPGQVGTSFFFPSSAPAPAPLATRKERRNKAQGGKKVHRACSTQHRESTDPTKGPSHVVKGTERGTRTAIGA
jgi:hypothetical protein